MSDRDSGLPSGELHFACGMGMFKGVVVTKTEDRPAALILYRLELVADHGDSDVPNALFDSFLTTLDAA